jgi:hypothetical protein
MGLEVLVEVHLVGEGFTAAFDGTDERADIEVYDSVVGLERIGLCVNKGLQDSMNALTALNRLVHPGS